MFLLVEGGATKTDWCLASSEKGKVLSFRTGGINVASMSEAVGDAVLREAFGRLENWLSEIGNIYLYAAGVVSGDVASSLGRKITEMSGCTSVSCKSDLVAAARALFGRAEGVAAIMGTGSNSCLCREGEVVRNIPAGGYVLGDEGGAVSLGRRFLSDWIKGLVPVEMADDFRGRYGLDYASVVRNVYREGSPSGFMASFAPFVMEYSGQAYADGLVEDCIDAFVSRNLARYGCPEVGVSGSYGCALKDVLERVGERYGLTFRKFIPSPLDGLVDFHLRDFSTPCGRSLRKI